MSLTITRNTNGDVDIISTSGELPEPQYNIPGGMSGISQHPSYVSSIVITSPCLPTGKLSIALSKITTINGSAPPGTMGAAITLLGDSVFFRKAPVGGGSAATYTPDGSSTAVTKTYLNTTYPAAKHGDLVLVATANVKYLKLDDSATGNWDTQPYNLTT